MNFRRHRQEQLEISITPMIDVVFLLLIFFMVTTTFDRESKLKINLPEAGREQQKVANAIEVTVDADGNYYVNQYKTVNRNLETLKKAISKAVGDKKHPSLIINADAKARHESVVRVLDGAQQLRISRISFATKVPFK